MIEERRATVGVAEFAVGPERLHEPLHGTEFVERAEAGRFVATGAVQAAEIVREQFFALGGGQRHVGIEQ